MKSRITSIADNAHNPLKDRRVRCDSCVCPEGCPPEKCVLNRKGGQRNQQDSEGSSGRLQLAS